MTAEDWAALADAGKTPGATAYLEGLASQKNAMLTGTGMVGTQNQPGAGQPTVSGQFQCWPGRHHSGGERLTPPLAWLLSVPELGPLIVQWAQQGLDPAAAEAQSSSPPPGTSSIPTRCAKWITET